MACSEEQRAYCARMRDMGEVHVGGCDGCPARVASKESVGVDLPEVEAATRRMLFGFGEDPEREGLRDTPRRVAKAWAEMLNGYEQDPAVVLGTTFEPDGYQGIVTLTRIPFASVCEHHLLPFTGIADIGYLPGKRIVGLSKLARVVYVYARRLQVQERMTAQIADALVSVLAPEGVAVRIRAEHSCMRLRGVRTRSGPMTTQEMRGTFRGDPAARAEVIGMFDSGGV